MFNRLIIIVLFLLLISCAGIGGGMIAGSYAKGSRASIFGRQCYKYKCVKAGECYENKECDAK